MANIKWPWPKEEINGDDNCPTYLYRWTLLRTPWCCVYLHHFVGDDWTRDLHDHPKRFISIGLKGGYREITPHKPVNWSILRYPPKIHDYQAPWIRTFSARHAHRIVMNHNVDCWTLVMVGPKTREWGFWHAKPVAYASHWIPWKQYVSDTGIVNEVKTC